MPFGEHLLNLCRGRPVGGSRERLADLARHRNVIEPVKTEPLRALVERLRPAGQDAAEQVDAAAAFHRLLVQIGINAERISHRAALLRKSRSPEGICCRSGLYRMRPAMSRHTHTGDILESPASATIWYRQ